MVKISRRLKEISDLVDDNANIIDIGCDHGLLDIYLFENKKNIKIIATDVLESALQQAKNNIQKYKLDKKIDVRLGDGLSPLTESDYIDTIIIAGLGWHTIFKILKDKNKLVNVKTIIIQSNSEVPMIRKKLIKLGYYIDAEKIVVDNKITYIIIKFKKGQKKYSDRELKLGPLLLNNKDITYINWLKKEIHRNKIILRLIPKKYILKRYNTRKYIKILEKEISKTHNLI